MNSKLKNSKIIYRKLKISDYQEFRKLFYFCFKRKASVEFFKWRYFNDKSSFCYGAFASSKLIANVGMISMKINNNEKIFSRHSSMVLKKYRGIGIYSKLLNEVRKKILKKVRLVVMWPNKNNFASFGIRKKNTFNKKYYLYKTSLNTLSKKIKNYPINELNKFKKFIEINENFFFKNFNYFKKRYLTYKTEEYLLNKFEFKKFSSFIVLKRSRDKSGTNYTILDHFGSEKIKSRHISYLILNQNRLIFLSKKKIYMRDYELLDKINFKIGYIKGINLKEKNNFLHNKEIFLGDTDIFITLE